jgi:uncharacterized membrane protein YukC
MLHLIFVQSQHANQAVVWNVIELVKNVLFVFQKMIAMGMFIVWILLLGFVQLDQRDVEVCTYNLSSPHT